MANRFWVGGTNTWDGTAGTKWATTSGGGGGAAVPTSADDVFFDANSTGVCTTSGARACRSLDCNGQAGSLVHAAASTITIGDGTAGAGNRALRLASTKYTANNNTTSKFVFASTSATQQTIDWAGGAPGSIDFNGSGGSWLFNDALTTRSTTTTVLSILAGTLDTNGKAVQVGVLRRDSNPAAATLTLGASALTLGSGATALDISSNASFTVNRGTSSITFSGNSIIIDGGGKTWGDISIAGAQAPVTFVSNNTWKSITWAGSAAQTNQMLLSGNQTVESAGFIVSGNSAANCVLVASSTSGTARTLTCAAVTLTDVDFQDITAAGTAAPFTGTRLGDFGGNTNITVSTGTKYLVAGSSNTTWASSIHFATSSGGATAANNYPKPQDTLVIDANSWSAGPRTITTTANQRHPTLNASAMPQNVTITRWQTVGSITLSTSKTTGLATISFQCRSAQTFTTGGASGWTGSSTVTLESWMGSGTVTMGDTLVASTVTLVLNGGTFIGGGFNHTIDILTMAIGLTGGLTLNALRTLTITTSASIGGTISASFAGLTMSGTTTTLQVFSDVTFLAVTIQTGGTTLATQTVGVTKTVTVTAMTIGAPRTITFTSNGVVFNLGSLTAIGSSGNLITVQTTSAGTATTMFTKSSGYIAVNWWSIKDSTVSGGATFYAGSHSTNVSGNTGWTFTDPPALTGTGTGSSTTSGSAAVTERMAATATGSSTTSGSAAGAKKHAVSASGASTTSGSAAITERVAATATGSSTTSGSASARVIESATTTGSSTTSGSAVTNLTWGATATGSSTTSGSVSAHFIYPATVTGSSTTTGSASACVAHAVTATGSSTTSGSAAGGVVTMVTATGSSVTTGSANAILPLPGMASGSSQTTGSADARFVQACMATGAVITSGSAAIGVVMTVSASGLTVTSGDDVTSRLRGPLPLIARSYRRVILDTVPPTIQATMTPSTHNPEDSFVLAATVDEEIAWARVLVTDSLGRVAEVGHQQAGMSITALISSSALPHGRIAVRVTVADMVGNQSEKRCEGWVHRDETGYYVTLTSRSAYYLSIRRSRVQT
jgi:uncharacterized membrane protein